MRAIGFFTVSLLFFAMAGASAAADPTRACHAAPGDPRDGRALCIRVDPNDPMVYAEDLCRAIAAHADFAGLPRGFFARLLWTESRFSPSAVSPMNAQGIAQFIPSTARLRGLADPFNPAEALAESARFLADLRRMFGSLGLAAVAYNAGEGRADAVLRRGARAPSETQAYVFQITGLAVADWADGAARPDVDYSLREPGPGEDAAHLEGAGFHDACVALAVTREIRRFEAPAGAWRPWGVQIASHPNAGVARRMFDRARSRFSAIRGEEPMVMRRRVRGLGPRPRTVYAIGRDTRGEAVALCRRIQAQGGACTVVRN